MIHLDQQHRNSTAYWHFQYKKHFFLDIFSNMYTVFYECSDIIETTDAHFFKKVRSLRYKYFSTNNTEHNMNLKVKEA